MSERRPAMWSAIVLCGVLTGCAPRPEIVDASDGRPRNASVRPLVGDRLLVEADGYESWSGPASATRIELYPLWQQRFLGERVPPRAQPPPPSACCPGTRTH